MAITKADNQKIYEENKVIIKFLFNEGMTPEQIKSLNYRQIDLKKKIIYFDKKVGKRFITKKIHYRGTPVENLFLREPFSRLFVLYRKYPFRNFYRRNMLILPPDCMYNEYEIKMIVEEDQEKEEVAGADPLQDSLSLSYA